MTSPRSNPFVGPRSYQTGETLYGRDHDVLKLLDLLIAERIVLLYSPSGAGKSSLVRAALVPRLRDEAFTVPTVSRVIFQSTASSDVISPNRYVSAVIASLDEALPPEKRLPTAELARITLADYLNRYWSEEAAGGGLVLIIDQFEEILNTDPSDLAAKHLFFSQLGSALHSPNYWALLSMREEHLAGLDPYRRLVPTQLSSAFRLELLKEEQAREATQRTAADGGIEFTDAAAQKLVDDLRRVRVQQLGGQFDEQLGLTIEPVQLQVVCYRLWDRLPDAQTKIEETDVEALGNVNTALADYYADVVAWVAERTATSERLVRDWIEDQLITALGLRNQVLQEDARQTHGLDDSAIAELVNEHLVRAERRRGVTWFELAHDRLVDPIRTDNARWREAHLTLFQRQASLWNSQGRPSHLELRGAILADAEHWAVEQGNTLTHAESDFLNACIERRLRERAERRRSRSVKVFGALALGLLMVLGADQYVKWRHDQPWGYVTDLFTGATYPLDGNTAWIGRAAGHMGNITYAVDVQPQVVSRLHFMISRSRRALDARSLNGTTVNARFLQYGYQRELRDGDLIALAGAAVFSFTPLAPPLLPFTERLAPRFPPPPSGTWAILIDGASKRIIPLIDGEYFVNRQDNGGIMLSHTKNAGSVLRVTREHDNEPAVSVLTQDATALVTIKYEDRYYYLIKIPVNNKITEFVEGVSGAEYTSKITICVANKDLSIDFQHVQASGSRPPLDVAVEEPESVPDCIVGPLQIISLR